MTSSGHCEKRCRMLPNKNFYETRNYFDFNKSVSFFSLVKDILGTLIKRFFCLIFLIHWFITGILIISKENPAVNWTVPHNQLLLQICFPPSVSILARYTNVTKWNEASELSYSLDLICCPFLAEPGYKISETWGIRASNLRDMGWGVEDSIGFSIFQFQPGRK